MHLVWFPFGGDGLRLPIIRIPAISITSWWFADGKVQKVGGRGGIGFGIGGIADF